MEKCTVVIVPRDRYSTSVACLDALLEYTTPNHDLIFVCGGAPEKVERALKEKYEARIKLIFMPQYLNPAQSRNIGMRACHTRLAVLMDNDVEVKPGWLEPLIACQQKTNAAMVVPIILEYGNEIHTAGNSLYVTHENGRAYAHKELRYHGMVVGEDTNLKREETDYGELHCQLVEVKAALELNAYDENIQEVGECDSGLTWKKADRRMWFEPKSIVNYEPPGRIAAEDIRFFVWRWDMRAILKGYRYFFQKWNMDVTEHGNFRNYLLGYNNKLGLLPRLFPSAWALEVDWFLKLFLGRMAKCFTISVSLWRRLKAWLLGYYAWPESVRNEDWQMQKIKIVPAIRKTKRNHY